MMQVDYISLVCVPEERRPKLGYI